MKLKCACFLIMLFGIHLTASPNRYFCNGFRCAENKKAPVAEKPATISITDADDAELIPTHYFLNRI